MTDLEWRVAVEEQDVSELMRKGTIHAYLGFCLCSFMIGRYLF